MIMSMRKVICLSLISLLISNQAIALGKKEFIQWGDSTFDLFWDIDNNKKNQKKLNAWLNIPMDCILGLPSDENGIVQSRDFDAINLGLHVGDVIQQINGKAFYDDSYLKLKLQKGDDIVLRVERGKKRIDVTSTCKLSRKSYSDFMVSLARSVKNDKPNECMKSVKNAFQNRSQLLSIHNLYPQCVFRSFEKGTILRNTYKKELETVVDFEFDILEQIFYINPAFNSKRTSRWLSYFQIKNENELVRYIDEKTRMLSSLKDDYRAKELFSEIFKILEASDTYQKVKDIEINEPNLPAQQRYETDEEYQLRIADLINSVQEIRVLHKVSLIGEILSSNSEYVKFEIDVPNDITISRDINTGSAEVMNQYGAKWETVTLTGSETVLRSKTAEYSKSIPIPLLRDYVKKKNSDVSIVNVFSYTPENPRTYERGWLTSRGSFEIRLSEEIIQTRVLAERIATGLYDETNGVWLGYLSKDGRYFFDHTAKDMLKLSEFWDSNSK